MLATERDWDLLEWLWRGWRDETGKKIPKMYEEYVNLMNEAARLNGSSKYFNISVCYLLSLGTIRVYFEVPKFGNVDIFVLSKYVCRLSNGVGICNYTNNLPTRSIQNKMEPLTQSRK